MLSISKGVFTANLIFLHTTHRYDDDVCLLGGCAFDFAYFSKKNNFYLKKY
jgi:hypothetical protein